MTYEDGCAIRRDYMDGGAWGERPTANSPLHSVSNRTPPSLHGLKPTQWRRTSTPWRFLRRSGRVAMQRWMMSDTVVSLTVASLYECEVRDCDQDQRATLVE
ncbi:hypothetical protein BC938DRAFT_477152 [Jimgerdemannia flammicorona]|uniref:Uncharacterized protein n=1 Tax=Jimgerdemannia flammicorona TaxID=994334 RepID=A0A433QYX3_9FUNG|nr:hypothetical protein BC938DRAFT_477152 [Jimgerdemannia flammicorona]